MDAICRIRVRMNDVQEQNPNRLSSQQPGGVGFNSSIYQVK
jgi:hypothetical protein